MTTPVVEDDVVERLREILSYDPDTGVFTWRTSRSPRTPAGSVAGCIDRANGYWRITVDYKLHLAHRLAWLYMTGTWPEKFIDHINGIKTDNRFVNLRQADKSQNSHNISRNRANTSGFKGVSWIKRDKRWKACISVRGQNIFLGAFDTPNAAYAAYCEAAQKYHGEFARTE